MTPLMLVATVGVVGILHTLVPDHWAPISVLARQYGWTNVQTARAAAIAGLGHVTSTLVLGAIVWSFGFVVAAHYGHALNSVAAVALIGFGGWIAVSSFLEQRAQQDHGHFAHSHRHRHPDGTEHAHWHEHRADDWHVEQSGTIVLHQHAHAAKGRTALLLILGSSPMFEGLPAFFAAAVHGAALLVTMSVVFATATIATYIAATLSATMGLRNASLGRFERYGEVLSGAIVVLVGVYALFT
jgi:putative Mn2+ efflux pump MntP